MQKDHQKKANTKIEQIAPVSFDAPDIQGQSAKSTFSKQHLIIGLIGFVILLLFAFMFMTKALLVTTNAEQSEITIQQGFNLPLGGDRYLIFNGAYQINVNAPGYHSKTVNPIINSETPSNLQIELAPLPGQIRATFAMSELPKNDMGMEDILGTVQLVSYNGETLPTSPSEDFTSEFPDNLPSDSANQFFFSNLEPGIYVIQADAYLYTSETIEVEVRGKELTEEISIDLEPNWGYLDIATAPEGAALYAENQLITENLSRLQSPDTATARIPVEVGTGFFNLKLVGYKPWTQELQVSSEQTIDLGIITLEPVDTQLQIETTPGAVSITVNDQFIGQTPLTLDLLPDTPHRIQLFKAGYQSQAHELTLAKNTVETRSFNLQPDLVNVSFRISPDNAQIRINGVQRGTGSQTISLPSINHQIEVTAPGHESRSLDFLPVKGARQLVQVRLLTDEQAIWANTPYQYENKAGNDMLLFRDAGLVALGSSRREPGRRANEVQWNANLSRAFYVSTTEVTNEEFRRFDNSHSSGHFETIGLDGPDRPIVGVSWQQAALYCNWLSEQSGLEPFYTIQKGFVAGVNPEATGYRLLTEAEWSYLARKTPAGLTQKYIWGNSEAAPAAINENFADQSISAKINFVLEDSNDGFPASAPVASFAPNDKGIYDLGGNVMEWINDWYQPVPQEGSEPVLDPLGPEEGEFHVIRGASWARGYLPQLRLAYRDYDSKGRNDLGFRLARYALPN